MITIVHRKDSLSQNSGGTLFFEVLSCLTSNGAKAQSSQAVLVMAMRQCKPKWTLVGMLRVSLSSSKKRSSDGF
jgi:hypothetical protein